MIFSCNSISWPIRGKFLTGIYNFRIMHNKILLTYSLLVIIQQSRCRTDTFDALCSDPYSHHTIHIQLALIKDMTSSKINHLPPCHEPKFIEKLVHYDVEVCKACSNMKQNLSKIVQKQYELAYTFVVLIDEVLHAKSENLDNDFEVSQATTKSECSDHESVSQSSTPYL